jgi:hypothetical protein
MCARLDFLAARLFVDFKWLKDENPRAFNSLVYAVGAVQASPGQFSTLSREIAYTFQGTIDAFSKEQYIDGKFRNKKLTKSEAEDELSKYTKQSDEYIRGIELAARKVGIILLTVEEYEAALYTEGSRNPNLIVMGEVTMSGDTYNTGQAAAVGRNAQANNTTMTQGITTKIQNLNELVPELEVLRLEMKKRSTEPENDIAIGAIAMAEKAAKGGDEGGVLAHLKIAGGWALGVAEKIGIDLAASAIKDALGMPVK